LKPVRVWRDFNALLPAGAAAGERYHTQAMKAIDR
jgi:hypothetical protein